VAIHACPANRNADERQWNIGHWAELIRLLSPRPVVFLGTWEDREYYERINALLDTRAEDGLLGRLTLEEVAAYLLRARCLVCVNSSIMHIAVLAGTPIVAIVGGTPARIILPERANIKVLEDPGLVDWNPQGEFTPRVSRLNEILPEMVMEKINELG
jgi:ADP-heptose:LPS heptosyltransferase